MTLFHVKLETACMEPRSYRSKEFTWHSGDLTCTWQWVIILKKCRILHLDTLDRYKAPSPPPAFMGSSTRAELDLETGWCLQSSQGGRKLTPRSFACIRFMYDGIKPSHQPAVACRFPDVYFWLRGNRFAEAVLCRLSGTESHVKIQRNTPCSLLTIAPPSPEKDHGCSKCKAWQGR